ncbi:MAG: TetR/AcrR family transcriptional regulator [Alphaproteobacteria bacterium]|nr:TetR/AcrR family transcriptional regulator [Alphaproteobacteria bacterium]
MPRPFSENERAAIHQRLMDEGLKRFARQGVRAMRIDDLCRDIGIAKGSFYAFFASKEALFFALADQRDEQHKSEMMAEMLAAQGEAETVLGLFFDTVMQRLETDPLMRIVQDAGELAYAMRHAPAGYVAENLRRDRAFVAELSDVLQSRFGLHHATARALEDGMTLMVALSLQRDYLATIGTYGSAVALLRSMCLKYLIEGSGND